MGIGFADVLFFEDILFDFMCIEHVLLFFLYFVANLNGGIFHDSNDVFIVFMLEEFFLSAV